MCEDKRKLTTNILSYFSKKPKIETIGSLSEYNIDNVSIYNIYFKYYVLILNIKMIINL